MTEPRDWLSDALDRHPGEQVPADFSIRLQSRIIAESRRGRLLRWPLRMAVAAAVVAALGAGYWMGMGAPRLGSSVQQVEPGDSASLEIQEIWKNRDLLESWDLLQEPEVQFALGELLTGSTLYADEDEGK